MYSLSLASVCSQVCLLCLTHSWPDFLSCSHRSRIPREKREQTEARVRWSPYNRETVCVERDMWFIVLANLLNRSLGSGDCQRSCWLSGNLVSKENKPTPRQINKYLHLPQQLTVNSCSFYENEWRNESISFEFASMTWCQPMWKTPVLRYPTLLLVLSPIVQKNQSRLKKSRLLRGKTAKHNLIMRDAVNVHPRSNQNREVIPVWVDLFLLM